MLNLSRMPHFARAYQVFPSSGLCFIESVHTGQKYTGSFTINLLGSNEENSKTHI